MDQALKEAIGLLRTPVLATKHIPDFEVKRVKAIKVVTEAYRAQHLVKVFSQPASITMENGTIIDMSINHAYPEPPLMLGDEGLQRMIDSLKGKD